MCFCVFTCTDISGHIFLIIIVYLDIYSIKLLFLDVIARLIIDVFAFVFINITLLTTCYGPHGENSQSVEA